MIKERKTEGWLTLISLLGSASVALGFVGTDTIEPIKHIAADIVKTAPAIVDTVKESSTQVVSSVQVIMDGISKIVAMIIGGGVAASYNHSRGKVKSAKVIANGKV